MQEETLCITYDCEPTFAPPCMYIMLLYPLIHQWMPRLPAHLGHCK